LFGYFSGFLRPRFFIRHHVHDVNALSAMRNKGKTQMIYGKRITWAKFL